MAMTFDGVAAMVDCRSDATINNVARGPFTLSAWVYPRSMGEGNFGTIASKYTGSVGWFLEFSGSGGSNIIEWFYECGGTDLIRRSNINGLTLNKWQNIIVTGDGGVTATNYHIYVDNTELTYLVSQNAIGSLSNDAVGPFKIGAEAAGADDWDGHISEVAFWKNTLTTSEIAQVALSRTKGIPLQISYPNLVGYWPLDDFSNGVIAAGSGTLMNRASNIPAINGTPSGNPVGRAEEVLTYQ